MTRRVLCRRSLSGAMVRSLCIAPLWTRLLANKTSFVAERRAPPPNGWRARERSRMTLPKRPRFLARLFELQKSASIAIVLGTTADLRRYGARTMSAGVEWGGG